ncbi:uncharacterized protein B0I36DRAFT_335566, partial [Microdochium trichocladiopsis]
MLWQKPSFSLPHRLSIPSLLPTSVVRICGPVLHIRLLVWPRHASHWWLDMSSASLCLRGTRLAQPLNQPWRSVCTVPAASAPSYTAFQWSR